jgi:hypothetical protein
MKLAERGIELVEERLAATESNDSGDIAVRAAFIRSSQKEIESAQQRLDESRKSYENAKLRG